MATISEALATAVQHHQAGRRQAAEQIYRQILTLDPNQPDVVHLLGLLAHEAGRHDLAIAYISQAIRLNGSISTYHNNLGNALCGQGKLDEAIASYRRALELRPTYAEAHTNLGAALQQQGMLERAIASYQRAIELKPDFAQAHNNLGTAYQRQGQLDQAIRCYRWALASKPDYVEAYYNQGNALTDQGKLDEAIACYQRTVELEPDYAEAHYSLGNAWKDRGEFEKSAACFRRALELQPNGSEARVALGKLQEEAGDSSEAEASYRTALRLQPSCPLPYAWLAHLLRGKLPEDDRIAIEQRLADPLLDPDTRARLLFALAAVFDARGQYPRAADALGQANALRLEHHRDGAAYCPAEHEQFTTETIKTFDRDFLAALAGSSPPSRRPVFIVGLPRSGTTLIEQVLASHSRIHGAGELDLVSRTFESIPSLTHGGDAPIVCARRLDAAAVRRLAETHLARLESIDRGRSERIVDKLPENYLHLGLLSVMFPCATFIHCRRDLRDVAVSCWMTDFRRMRWTNAPEHIASRFVQYQRMIDHWRAVLPVPILDVDYEQSIADLETVARRLIDAVGLDWEEACLEFYRTRRPIRTASDMQARQPIYAHSVGRWKNYQHELAGLFALLPQRATAAIP